MARKINAGENVGRFDVFMVDPRNVKVDPSLRARWELEPPGPERVRELAESFLEHGQSNPCVARMDPSDKTLIIEQGQTRHAAAMWILENRDPKFRLQVKVVDRNEEEGFVCAIEENRIRTETTPMDDAYNMRRLRNSYGWDDPKIEALFKCRSAYLRNLETLLALPIRIQRLVHRGELAVSNAMLLANLSGDDLQDALTEAESQRTISGRVTGAAVRPAVRNRVNNGQKVARTLRDIRLSFATICVRPDATPKVQEFTEMFQGFAKGEVSEVEFSDRVVELLG